MPVDGEEELMVANVAVRAVGHAETRCSVAI